MRLKLRQDPDRQETECRIGLATMAALFPMDKDRERSLVIRVPLEDELKREHPSAPLKTTDWRAATADAARLEISDQRINFIYEAALRPWSCSRPAMWFPVPLSTGASGFGTPA